MGPKFAVKQGTNSGFLLGFPNLYMDAADDSEVETHDNNTDVCASNMSSSRTHHSVNVSKRTWKFTTNLAPQDIWIEIRTDPGMQRNSVRLKKGNEISRYVWQDWVESAMGFMAGYNERGGGKIEIGAQDKKGGLTRWNGAINSPANRLWRKNDTNE